jgi:hypothetical protein
MPWSTLPTELRTEAIVVWVLFALSLPLASLQVLASSYRRRLRESLARQGLHADVGSRSYDGYVPVVVRSLLLPLHVLMLARSYYVVGTGRAWMAVDTFSFNLVTVGLIAVVLFIVYHICASAFITVHSQAPSWLRVSFVGASLGLYVNSLVCDAVRVATDREWVVGVFLVGCAAMEMVGLIALVLAYRSIRRVAEPPKFRRAVVLLVGFGLVVAAAQVTNALGFFEDRSKPWFTDVTRDYNRWRGAFIALQYVCLALLTWYSWSRLADAVPATRAMCCARSVHDSIDEDARRLAKGELRVEASVTVRSSQQEAPAARNDSYKRASDSTVHDPQLRLATALSEAESATRSQDLPPVGSP